MQRAGAAADMEQQFLFHRPCSRRSSCIRMQALTATLSESMRGSCSRRTSGKRSSSRGSSPRPSLPKSSRQGHSSAARGREAFAGVRAGHVDMGIPGPGLWRPARPRRGTPGRRRRGGPSGRCARPWDGWGARSSPARASAETPNAEAQRKTVPRLPGSWTSTSPTVIGWQRKSISAAGRSRTATSGGGLFNPETFSSTWGVTSQYSPTAAAISGRSFSAAALTSSLSTTSRRARMSRTSFSPSKKNSAVPGGQQLFQPGVGAGR